MSQEIDENSSITPIEVDISTFDVSLTQINFCQKINSGIEKLSKRKRSYSNNELTIDKLETNDKKSSINATHSIQEDNNCETPKHVCCFNMEQTNATEKSQDILLPSEYKLTICKICKKSLSGDELIHKNMRSSSHSSNQCESISCMESTVGESISSLSFLPIFKDSMIDKTTMTNISDMVTFKNILADRMHPIKELAKIFGKKMKILKEENIQFRREIEQMHLKIGVLSQEREQNSLIIKKLKQKLINTISFMTTNSDPGSKPLPCYLESLIQQNRDLEEKIRSVESENSILRKMLTVNRELNSFKSFEHELKSMEEEAQSESHKPKVSNTGDNHSESTELNPENQESCKFKAGDLVRKTIRERNKRMGRKRTDSFNFPSFGESSSDEEVAKPHVIQSSAKIEKSDFSGYKMKTIDDNQAKESELKAQEKPKLEEVTSCDKSSNLVVRRRRTNSEDTSNNLKIFSPPSSIRTARKTIINNDEEEDSEQMLKGGGYKMCIKTEEAAKEEEKKIDSNDEQDYINCFNKNKKFNKRDRRTQSLLESEDEKKSELAESVLKIVPKIKYSIHSIIEEEKSRSSSSASSAKSSDDLTFLYSSKPNKRKKSSFCNFSMKLSISSMKGTNSSSGDSSIKAKNYKVKKYTEGLINPFYDFSDIKFKSRKKLKRGSSMNITMNSLDLDFS